MGGFTDGVLESFAAWLNTDSENYLSALASMYETVFSIVEDVGDPDDPTTYSPAWSTILDPTTCPTEFLPYLSQFVGAGVQPGTPDAVARAQITGGAALNRGQGFAGSYTSSTIPAGGSIVTTAQRFLTGTQAVVLQERTAANGSPDPYHFVLVVRPEEAQPINLVPDPSFEYDTLGATSGLLGWSETGSPSVYQVQSGWAASGSQSLRVTTSTVVTAFTQLGAHSTPILAAAAQAYSVQAVFNTLVLTGTASVNIALTWYSNAGGTTGINSVFSTPITIDGVATSSMTAVAPAFTQSVRVGLQFNSGSNAAANASADFYVDDALLTASTPTLPQTYFDGDTPGYQWIGLPGDSASQMPIVPLVAAVNAVKPGGVQWTLIQSDAFLFNQAENDFASDTMTFIQAATTQP